MIISRWIQTYASFALFSKSQCAVAGFQGSFLSQTVLGSQTLQSVSASSSPLPPSSSSSPSPSSSTQLPGILAQNYTAWREEAGSVEEALFSLNTSLEDFRGQYNELQLLEETVAALETFIRVSGLAVVVIVQALCESRGGHPGLSVLKSLLVSVDVKLYWIMLQHWSQLVPNVSTNIRGQ